MEQNAILVCVGESFQVSLQSMLGSTNYAWVLTNLPEGIVLAGYEVTKVQEGVTPVNQIFHFGVTKMNSKENEKTHLTFQMVCFSDFRKCIDEIEIDVIITDAAMDSRKQVKKVIQYSNNCAVYNAQIPYGFPLTSEPLVKYGAPCDEALVKYGAPCDAEKIVLKYGYPDCPADNALLKYGAPCDEALVKYGAPCDEALVKYGAPCDEADPE